MAATDIIAIWTRLHELMRSENLKLCDDPFTFERAPRQTYGGGVYRIEAEGTGDPGRYIGGARNEHHKIDCWVLRPNRGAKTDNAYSRMLTDLDKLRTLFEQDGDSADGPDYYVMDGTVSTAVRAGPAQGDIYLMGNLSFEVDFDRDPDTAVT